MNDNFTIGLVATIGIDNEFQCVQLTDGSIIKLRVLDTAGQEIYNSINENYYKDADGCLLVYDITNNDSFERIKDYYIQKIKEKCKKNIKIVLLGNKTDKNDERKVSDKDGRDLALKNNYIFMESSCKDNYNVSDAFTALVEMTNNDMIKEKENNTNNFSLDETKGENFDNKSNSQKSCC